MHVCNKCCTSKKLSSKDIFAIIHLQNQGTSNDQRSELVELSLNILGKSILMRQASCDLKTSNASYICSICSALSRASSWLTRIAWEDTNLSVNHFSHASPQPFKDPVNHSILLWLLLPESFANTISGLRDDSSLTHQPKSNVNFNVKKLLLVNEGK